MKKKHLLFFILPLLFIVLYFLTIKKNKDTQENIKESTESHIVSKLKSLSVSSEFSTNMEDPDPSLWIGEKSPEKYSSGKFSNKLSELAEYGITFYKRRLDIPQYDKIRQAKVSFQLFTIIPLKKASYVFSVSGAGGKMYEYFRENINSTPGKWLENNIIFNVNPNLWAEDATIKIYPWNPSKELFYVDDIHIEFISETESLTGIVLGPVQNYYTDFEPRADSMSSENLSREVSHSGQYSFVLKGADTYSETVTKKFSEISKEPLKFISTGVWLYPKESNTDVTLVVSIEDMVGKSISWQGKATGNMNLEKNKWHRLNFRADLRNLNTNPSDLIKIYLWNKGAGTVFADDLEIAYGDLPKPAGNKPGIVMNISGSPSDRQGKNEGPFPVAFFGSYEKKLPVSCYLVDDSTGRAGEMNPSVTTIGGNFSGFDYLQDEIFISDESTWSLYRWCDNKKFIEIISSKALCQMNGKVILPGHFEEWNKEEILLIDTGERSSAIQSIQFFAEPGNNCNKKSGGQVKIQKPRPETLSEIFTSDFKHISAGNFSGDQREEILIFSTNGTWKLIDKKEGELRVLSKGSISKGTILSVHSIDLGKACGKLLLFYEKNQKLDYCLLDFAKGNNSCTAIELNDKSFLANYSPNSRFISGYFSNADVPDLFFLNKEWRFDLKKVNLTKDGIFIERQMDFAQAIPNRNPKFYEYTNLIRGNFFAQKADQLLIQMRNCKDVDFDGRSCNEFEERKDLPSCYSFYQFKTPD